MSFFATSAKLIYKTAPVCSGMSPSPRADHEKSWKDFM